MVAMSLISFPVKSFEVFSFLYLSTLNVFIITKMLAAQRPPPTSNLLKIQSTEIMSGNDSI